MRQTLLQQALTKLASEHLRFTEAEMKELRIYYDSQAMARIEQRIKECQGMVKFLAADGLLFDEEGEVVDCSRADTIAFANKIWYAERLVEQYKGKIIHVEYNMIVNTSEDAAEIERWKVLINVKTLRARSKQRG